MGCIDVHPNGMWTWKRPVWSCRQHTCQLLLLALPLVYFALYPALVVEHGTFAPHNSYTYFHAYQPPTPWPADIEAAIMHADWLDAWHRRPVQALAGDAAAEAALEAALRDNPTAPVRPRVVVTMSTLPHRMESINETLQSLVAQELRPDAIYLNVPWHSTRMNVSYSVPPALAAWAAITIVRCDDLGPATKLIPALHRESGAPDSIVVTVDVDHVYPPAVLRHLVWYSERDPTVTWTVNGWAFLFPPARHDVLTVYAPFSWMRGAGRYVDVCQAVNGIAYRRGHFRDLAVLSRPHKDCFTTDDMWFSGVLAAASDVRRVMIPVITDAVDAKDAAWRIAERAAKSAKASRDRQSSLSYHNKKNNQDIRCIDGIRQTFGKPWPVVQDYEPAPWWRAAAVLGAGSAAARGSVNSHGHSHGGGPDITVHDSPVGTPSHQLRTLGHTHGAGGAGGGGLGLGGLSFACCANKLSTAGGPSGCRRAVSVRAWRGRAVGLCLAVVVAVLAMSVSDEPHSFLSWSGLLGSARKYELPPRSCGWDYEGRWHVRMWRGTAPQTLRPRTDVLNPVITCATVTPPPISFVADPFLVIPAVETARAAAAGAQAQWQANCLQAQQQQLQLQLQSPQQPARPALSDAALQRQCSVLQTPLTTYAANVTARVGGAQWVHRVDEERALPVGPYFAFYEMKNLARAPGQMGELGVARSDDTGVHWAHVGTALAEPWHLSYPNVFRHHSMPKQWLMIPETGAVGQIRLYTTPDAAFPLGWRFDHALVDDGQPWRDTAVVRFNGTLWMISTDGSYSLRVWYSSAANGDHMRAGWTEHPKSPVVKRSRAYGRSGGPPVVHDNYVYRFAQDCTAFYGESLHVFRIEALTRTAYAETLIKTWRPSDRDHTAVPPPSLVASAAGGLVSAAASALNGDAAIRPGGAPLTPGAAALPNAKRSLVAPAAGGAAAAAADAVPAAVLYRVHHMHAVEVSPGQWLGLSDADDTPYGYHYYAREADIVAFKPWALGVGVLLLSVLLAGWAAELHVTWHCVKHVAVVRVYSSAADQWARWRGTLQNGVAWALVTALTIATAFAVAMLCSMFVVFAVAPRLADRYDGAADLSIYSSQTEATTTAAAVSAVAAAPTAAAATAAASAILAAASSAAHNASSDGHSNEFVIVTGGSASYFDRLTNLVGSVHVWEPTRRIVIYDYGLTQQQLAVANCWRHVTLRRFEFADYPLHVRNLFNYALKPLLIGDALRHDRRVLVLDAGIEVRAPLAPIEQMLDAHGYWVATQPNRVSGKTHRAMYGRIQPPVDPADSVGQSFCAGGLQGYVRDSYAYRHVLLPAIRCALDEDCIAPDGSGRGNHNFDQSVTSALFYAHGLTCSSNRVWAEMTMARATLDPFVRNAVVMAGRRWHTPFPYLGAVQRRPNPQQSCAPFAPYGVYDYGLIENKQSAHIEANSDLARCLRRTGNARAANSECRHLIAAHRQQPNHDLNVSVRAWFEYHFWVKGYKAARAPVTFALAFVLLAAWLLAIRAGWALTFDACLERCCACCRPIGAANTSGGRGVNGSALGPQRSHGHEISP